MAQSARAHLTLGSLKFPTPSAYSGKAEEWEDWSYKCRAYMTISNSEYSELMKYAEGATTVITDELLGVPLEGGEIDRRRVDLGHILHYTLVQLTSASAATVVRQVESMNGFETWRLLHTRFALPSAAKTMGLLTRIMKPTFAEKDFEVQFTQWEATVSKYEVESTSLLPDVVKNAILLNETHGPLRQHLQLNTNQTTAYAQIRQTIVDYHRTRHTYNQKDVSTPMDVDAMTTKGKGKGKGKGKKGKGKGDDSTKGSNYHDNNYKGSKSNKGKDNYSKGSKGTTKGKSKGGGKGTLQCSHCGKLGHTVDKCWWVNATTSEEQGASSSTTADAGTTQVASFDWVMSYGLDEVPNDREKLLLDSGASIHACPLHYASDIPLAEQSGATQMRTVRTVSGAHMKVYGTRTVGYLFGTIRASITYVVTDVQYPVVSVSKLLTKGYNVYLSTDESYVCKGEHSCSVYKKGHPNYLFYLCPDGRIDTSPTLAPLLTSKSTAKDFRPKHQDYWKVDGDHLVRVHKLPRKALFVPTGTTDRPIPLDRLTEQRSTTYKFLQDTTSHKHEDSWSTHAQSVLLSRHWIGETRFLLKPADPTAPAPTARFRVTGKSAPTVATEPATSPVPMQVEADAPTAAPSQVLPPAHFAPARGAGPTGPGPPTFERPPGLPVDYWEKRGYTWIRHHVIPRTTLYVPLLVPAPVAQIHLLLSLPVPQSCRLVKALLLRIVMSGMYGERRSVALHLGQGIRSLRSTYSCLLLQTTTWDHPQQLLGVYHRQQNLRHSSALLTT